jgi:hypothetical protein
MVFVYKPLLGNHATVDVTCTLQAIRRLFTTVARRSRNSCWAADVRAAAAWYTPCNATIGSSHVPRLYKWAAIKKWNDLLVGFEVFTAVVMKSIIFWDMTPCSPFSFNRRFGGTYRLHPQGRRNRFSKPASKQVASRLISSLLYSDVIVMVAPYPNIKSGVSSIQFIDRSSFCGNVSDPLESSWTKCRDL